MHIEGDWLTQKNSSGWQEDVLPQSSSKPLGQSRTPSHTSAPGMQVIPSRQLKLSLGQSRGSMGLGGVGGSVVVAAEVSGSALGANREPLVDGCAGNGDDECVGLVVSAKNSIVVPTVSAGMFLHLPGCTSMSSMATSLGNIPFSPLTTTENRNGRSERSA